ncbi:hypothetical protein ACFVW1_40240 [Streptomyces olivochromogenes]|uniref:hypothetical protein n=1 Tax=Streptomyces olivochromogenes TaxID=1963 RepID=UPI0036D7A62B
MTAAADKLAQEDLGDVGILQLACVLAPVVLLAADLDLVRHDVAARDWPALRTVLGKIGAAEQAVRGSTAAMELSSRSLIETVRLARAYPPATGALAAAASIYAYRNHARLPQARTTLSRVGMEVLQFLAEPFARHELHTGTWTDAERGVPTDDLPSLVARLLARAPEPLTRTDILSALPAAAQHPHRRQMVGLAASCTASPPSTSPPPGTGRSAGPTCSSSPRPGHSGAHGHHVGGHGDGLDTVEAVELVAVLRRFERGDQLVDDERALSRVWESPSSLRGQTRKSASAATPAQAATNTTVPATARPTEPTST